MDRLAGRHPPAGTLNGTFLTLVAGVVVWAALVFWLHALLIGVPPI